MNLHAKKNMVQITAIDILKFAFDGINWDWAAGAASYEEIYTHRRNCIWFIASHRL